MNSSEQRDYLTPNQTYLPALPNATVSLVLGILSIVICGAGLVMGIIGLVLANKDLALFNNQPGVYSISSYNNTKTGRVCSIIGIILNALGIILYIGIIIFAFAMQDSFAS
jgi:M penetrans paralogue family 26